MAQLAQGLGLEENQDMEQPLLPDGSPATVPARTAQKRTDLYFGVYNALKDRAKGCKERIRRLVRDRIEGNLTLVAHHLPDREAG
ncbi:MAG: hypothetical protein O7A69_00210 [SAR324 cluster bacterium]|nr:hypothetical protein [SAR324 cluster bacterium]